MRGYTVCKKLYSLFSSAFPFVPLLGAEKISLLVTGSFACFSDEFKLPSLSTKENEKVFNNLLTLTLW